MKDKDKILEVAKKILQEKSKAFDVLNNDEAISYFENRIDLNDFSKIKKSQESLRMFLNSMDKESIINYFLQERLNSEMTIKQLIDTIRLIRDALNEYIKSIDNWLREVNDGFKSN